MKYMSCLLVCFLFFSSFCFSQKGPPKEGDVKTNAKFTTLEDEEFDLYEWLGKDQHILLHTVFNT